jgi:peptidoglycan endopeptidase LytE
MRRFPIIVLFLASFLALHASPSQAKTYKVRKGDSLARIAKRQHVSVDALKAANGLADDALMPGMKLTVPPKGKTAGKAAAEKTAQPSARAESPVEEPKTAPAEAVHAAPSSPAGSGGTEWAGYHTVRQGDTFAAVAQANGISIDDLKRLNPGKKSNRLKIGMRLRIKEAGAVAAAPETGKPAETAAAKTPARSGAPENRVAASSPAPAEGEAVHARKPVYHKVAKGETLASIGSTYGVSAKSLRRMNHMKKAKRLKPGTRLLVRRGSGDGGGALTADRRKELERVLRAEAELAVAQGGLSGDTTEIRAAAFDNISQDVPEAGPVTIKDRVTRIAKLMLDLPYRFGGTALTGIDCSGYVQKVFGFLNIPLPRSAREQFVKGEKIDKDELSTGDLVFFRTYARFPSHVGIYLGDNKFIHASSGDHKVKIDDLDTPYFVKRFIGARRLLPEKNEEEP